MSKKLHKLDTDTLCDVLENKVPLHEAPKYLNKEQLEDSSSDEEEQKINQELVPSPKECMQEQYSSVQT